MTSRFRRRLAADHGSLHTNGLPPNYLFHPSAQLDTLTGLSVLLAGPDSTPYAHGLFHLELTIPTTYPAAPPTAHFRTKIFHPNVDPATGAVCVDTLKRDWRSDLTLRDILLTIYCLLAYPNPASALNEEAGMLIEEDFAAFDRRASLWTSMYAAIPAELRDRVDEARRRGETHAKDTVAEKTGAAATKRRKAEEVLPRDAEAAENCNHADNAASGSAKSFDKSEAAAQVGSGPLRGLGLNIETRSGYEALDIEATPPQRLVSPPMRRSRKRYQLATPPNVFSSYASSSFTRGVVTPTPLVKHGESKRLRLSPPFEITRNGPAASRGSPVPSKSGANLYPWLDWHHKIHPELNPSFSQEVRLDHERKRMKAAGGSIERYNSGAFGLRTGIMRL